MKIRWSSRAKRDLEAIRDYIAHDSEVYAKRFVARLAQAARQIQRQPQIGRRVPEALDAPGDIREILYRSYRMLYRIEPDGVGIIAVVHGARDLASADPKPWELV